jgi:hypothetical protein
MEGIQKNEGFCIRSLVKIVSWWRWKIFGKSPTAVGYIFIAHSSLYLFNLSYNSLVCYFSAALAENRYYLYHKSIFEQNAFIRKNLLCAE